MTSSEPSGLSRTTNMFCSAGRRQEGQYLEGACCSGGRKQRLTMVPTSVSQCSLPSSHRFWLYPFSAASTWGTTPCA